MVANNETFSVFGGNETEGGFEFSHYGYRILAACIMSVMTLIGVFGNSLVIVALFLSNKLQTTTNVFVVCLAATDLLNCIFFPVQVISLLHRDGPPPIGFVCGAAGAIIITTNIVSIVILTLIAVNRWVKITRSHDTYSRIYSRRNLVLMIIISWCYPILAMIIPQISGLGSLGYSKRYKTCVWSDDQENALVMPMVFSLSVITAAIVIASSYVGIALHVRKQTRKIIASHSNTISQSQRPPYRCISIHGSLVSAQNDASSREVEQRTNPWNAREIKVTKNLATVVCVFFVLVLPYGVCSVIPNSYIPFICFSILLLTNSIINPIIYAFKHPVFSQVFLCIFRCRLADVPEPSQGLRSILQRR